MNYDNVFDMNMKGDKMIKFLENPHQILLDAVNELYPNADADIIFLDKESYDEFVENKESYACVKFTDNLKPLIVVCIDVPYVASIELIAHEIAHVVCGYTDDPEKAHGEEWKTVFTKINERYSQKVDEVFEDAGNALVKAMNDVSTRNNN